MRAAEDTSSKAQAAVLRRKCQKLIVYAESLKACIAPAVQQKQRDAQKDILQTASRLHGNDFPPWEDDPLDEEFDVPADGSLFM